jgi:hypothetical protein
MRDLKKRAALAQLVEHRIRNAGVRCSSHLSGTIKLQQKQSVTEGSGVIVRSLIFCARTMSARLSSFPVVAGPKSVVDRETWSERQTLRSMVTVDQRLDCNEIKAVGEKIGRKVFQILITQVRIDLKASPKGSRYRKFVALKGLIAYSAGYEVVIVAIGKPPVFALGPKMLNVTNVTVVHDGSRCLAIGAFIMRLCEQLILGRFPVRALVLPVMLAEGAALNIAFSFQKLERFCQPFRPGKVLVDGSGIPHPLQRNHFRASR